MHKLSSCSKVCIFSAIELINSTNGFLEYFLSFTKQIHTVDNNFKKIVFYKFFKKMKDKGYIVTYLDYFYISTYIFEINYHEFLYSFSNSQNTFVNSKILLFNWIELKHLDYKLESKYNTYDIIFYEYDRIEELMTISNFLISLKYFKHPSKKLQILLSAIKKIYDIIGCDSSYDNLFPLIIFVLIKTQFLDFSLHLEYTKNYFLDYKAIDFRECKRKVCECYINLNYDKKIVECYLTAYEAAILFIERLEFKNLKISQEEFDTNVIKNISNIENIFIYDDKKEKKKIAIKVSDKILAFFNYFR